MDTYTPYEVRPLFSSSRPERSTTLTSHSALARLEDCIEATPDTSVSDADSANSKLTTEIINEIDAQIEEIRSNDEAGVAIGNLADLIIAEIDAEIDASRSQSEDKGETKAIFLAAASENTDTPEYEPLVITLAEAKTRVQRFETSYDYQAYSNDLCFRKRILASQPHLPLYRVEGRISAFEGSEEYKRYLQTLGMFLKYGDETDVTAAYEHGLVLEKSSDQAPGTENTGRVKGCLSESWNSLDAKEKPR